MSLLARCGLIGSFLAMLGSGASAQQGAGAALAGNPTVAPLNRAGMLLYETLKGASGVCTAQFVASNVILTAAHCVRDRETGKFFDVSKMFFGLQYQNGQASRVFKSQCSFTVRGWVMPSVPNMTAQQKSVALSKTWQFDYAFIVLDGRSPNGWNEVTANWKSGEWRGATATGYPGKLLDGAVIQQKRGNLFTLQQVDIAEDPDLENVLVLWHGALDFTQGSSGGAWIGNMGSDTSKPDNNRVLSVTSFGMPNSRPGASFGPYLNDNFLNLFNLAKAGCPK